MTKSPILGSKFVSGHAETGRLYLTRKDGSQARCDVVILTGSITDNLDGTYDLTLGGS